MEMTSAEEVSHVGNTEAERESKEPVRVLQEDNGNGRAESKPQTRGSGTATQAQCRALYALTKKARYSDQDVESMLRPLNASTFQDLSRESASQLISYLQTEVAA